VSNELVANWRAGNTRSWKLQEIAGKHKFEADSRRDVGPVKREEDYSSKRNRNKISGKIQDL